MEVFEEGTSGSDGLTFTISADSLEKHKTTVARKAFGIPFLITDAEAVDRVCRYQGCTVEIHGVSRYMLPFWLLQTAAAGRFKADVLQRDPAQLTQQHCHVWVEGPRYEFVYPFGEYLPINQVSASYVEPPRVVEQCLCGSHIPSMLLSRFELLQELEGMPQKPKLIPFTMSTTTALSIVESRITRRMVLDRVDAELRKFHGSFLRSCVTLTALHTQAEHILPAFLPLLKLTISTASHGSPVPMYVCGATGKVVGPVVNTATVRNVGYSAAVAVGSLVALAPFLGPGMATAVAIGSAVMTPMIHQRLQAASYLKERAQQLAELKTIGLLNLGSDTTGYRWTPEDEERQEYEYREELRCRARQKEAFERQVQEEAARDRARQQGQTVDARRRLRADLENMDPLGYYALLGLTGRELTATSSEISKSFREAVRIHHPDVNTSADADAKKNHMQSIIEAYKILRDPTTKKAYDCGELKRSPGA